MEQNIQRIAIVRLSALGDVCHAIAVVTAIQKQYPDAQITWITGPLEAQLVRLMDGIDVRVYDKKSGIKGMLALRKELSNITFDVLLHLQWSVRASLLTLMLKVKRRIGFARSVSRENQHWFVNELAPEPKGPHVLDAFQSQATLLGVSDVTFPVPLSITPAVRKRPYVVINPSASAPERSWLPSRYAYLAQFLMARDFHVILTGGPSDIERKMAVEIEHMTPVDENMVGKTNLAEMLALLAGAAFVISPDTGPAHMATLVGVPVIGLYAHSNPARTGPYNSTKHVVSVYESLIYKEYGKPSDALPWATRVHDPDAMIHISEEMVLEKINALIAETSPQA